MTTHENCECDICKGKYTRPELMQNIAGVIEKFGQQMIMVGPTEERYRDRRESYFTYTIGNHQVGLPELIIVGFSGRDIGAILNVLSDQQRREGKPFKNGDVVPVGAGKVKIITANAFAQELIGMAHEHYGADHLDLQQVVLSDVNGNFPGDPGCVEPFSSQPVFNLH